MGTKIKSKDDRPKAKFVHWMGDTFELHAMFQLPSGSTVGIDTIDDMGLPYKKPPTYETWKHKVDKRERCRACWSVTRTTDDWFRHMALKHPVVKS